jgi:hypothetical protein
MVKPHPSLGIGLHSANSVTSKTEHADRGDDRTVRLIAGNYIYMRSAQQAIALNVPLGFAQDVVSSSQQRCESRHMSARNEADTPSYR